MSERRLTLLLTLCAFFIGFFICSNLIGTKLFSFSLLGIGPHSLGLGNATTFVATAGILAFPLTFILTDIINEYYGWRTVRVFSILAVAVSLILQVVVQAAAQVPTVQFDPMPPLLEAVAKAQPLQLATSATAALAESANRNGIAHSAYMLALAGSMAVVIGSLMAFMVGQLLDVWVFTRLRHLTKGKALWLRAQGSTVISQLVDTFVVIYVAFVFIPLLIGGQAWPAFSHLSDFSAWSVSVTNYVYKFVIAVALTPLLYFIHALMDRWIGHDEAARMVEAAHRRD